ncbi:uncharacterized protein [Diadema antillarum]|uniref:uncharacterized protein n=1 Tax=Diadema antillarum TaxID=105358 RepID=UPI003A862312
MATSSTDQVARIMIWSPPRSVSTAFARSMSARGDTEVFWEPYLACYYYGPERKVNWAESAPEMLNDNYTYSYVDKLLDADYPDSKVLFVKGMIEGIRGDFDIVNPKYKHSFLVRRPEKTYKSLDHMSKVVPGKPHDLITAFKNIYHDLEDFYNHVQTKLSQPSPPIIDADDLVAHPETILPKYCEAMGIEFTPKMLEWDSVDARELRWHFADVGDIFHEATRNTIVLSNAMHGRGFGEAPKLAHYTDSTLSSLVEEYTEHAMPVYERFYELRIKP